jgi:serine/threonine protein kinase
MDGRERVLKVVDLDKLSRVKDSDSAEDKGKKNAIALKHQQRLMEEFVMAKNLSADCARIVRSEEAWHDPPKFYIMMEFCERGSLQDLWEEVYDQLENGEIIVGEDTNENPFISCGGMVSVFGSTTVPLEKIMFQILEALVFLEERRVAHLDIKPDNVFIDGNGDMKIGDFGLCKSVTTKKGAVTTIYGNSYGTEGFMAPEIIKGQPANTKADVYSAGVLIFLFVMLRSVERTDPLPLKINEKLWPNNGNRVSLAQRMLEENLALRPLASEILAMLKVSIALLLRMRVADQHLQSRGAPAPGPLPAPRQVR